ncbi:unnamed protein product [Rotaria sp. Silwood1]|nr:unnamed protein product [Rotaria sp. Silwood1]
MSKKTVCADADLTVFNLKTRIRLVLVEDKRVDNALSRDESGEPQLVAEAIAAAMYNRNINTQHNPCRAKSEPPTDDTKSPQPAMMNTLSTSDVSL